MTPTGGRDVLDRVLADASRAATGGDHVLALELLLLALDLAPADPGVLLRAQQVQAMLPPAAARPHSASGAPSVARDPRRPTFAPKQVGGVEAVAPPAPEGPRDDGLALASTDATVLLTEQRNRDIQDALQAAAELETADQVRRERVAAALIAATRRRRQRLWLAVSYAVLVAVLGLASVTVWRRELVVSLWDRVRAVTDPMARAEMAYAAGDLAVARAAAEVATQHGPTAARAHILLAYVAWQTDDTAATTEAARRAAAADSSWATLLAAARLLGAGGNTSEGAAAAFAAYERGAPTSAWVEIAQALTRGGQPRRALGILEVARRAGLAVPAPESLLVRPPVDLPPYRYP